MVTGHPLRVSFGEGQPQLQALQIAPIVTNKGVSRYMIGSSDIFIVGPTASGKSQRAIEWASEWASEWAIEIVNCDSLQFYKDLKKGTAYPTLSDFKAVKHHLFGVVSLGTRFTAGEFVRSFKDLRQEFKDQKFLCVGGSGFYIKALETGLYDLTPSSSVPKDFHSSLFHSSLPHSSLLHNSLSSEVQPSTQESESKVQNRDFRIEEMSRSEKYDVLKEVDPEILKTIHPHDDYRLGRALEMFFTSGIQPSVLKSKGGIYSLQPPRPKLGLYLSREELKRRISTRVDQMIRGGLIEEVEAILQKLKEKNLSLAWKPLQSVGYKQTLMFLNGDLSREELKSTIIQSTLHLAKRQMTWFRSDKSVLWFHALKEVEKARLWLKNYLGE